MSENEEDMWEAERQDICASSVELLQRVAVIIVLLIAHATYEAAPRRCFVWSRGVCGGGLLSSLLVSCELLTSTDVPLSPPTPYSPLPNSNIPHTLPTPISASTNVRMYPAARRRPTPPPHPTFYTISLSTAASARFAQFAHGVDTCTRTRPEVVYFILLMYVSYLCARALSSSLVLLLFCLFLCTASIVLL